MNTYMRVNYIVLVLSVTGHTYIKIFDFDLYIVKADPVEKVRAII